MSDTSVLDQLQGVLVKTQSCNPATRAEVCMQMLRHMIKLHHGFDADQVEALQSAHDGMARRISYQGFNQCREEEPGGEGAAASFSSKSEQNDNSVADETENNNITRRSKQKQLLQPKREAPAPPPAPASPLTSTRHDTLTPEDHPKRSNSSGSKKSPKMPVRPAPAPARPDASSPGVSVEDGPVDFQKLKQWLKRHRLHKYASNFSTLTYTGITNLSEVDLERLGITAQGARTKMLKSIADLKILNVQRERDLDQVQTNVARGLYQQAIQGMADLLHLPNSNGGSANVTDSPCPPGWNLTLMTMTIVQDVVVGVLSGSVPNQPAEGAVADAARTLAAFLEQVMRLEFFSLDQRSQLFTWKSAAENVSGNSALQQNHQLYQQQQQELHKPQRPASSGVVLDARSKGFEPTWRSVEPPPMHAEEPGAWKAGSTADSVWGASVMTGTAGPPSGLVFTRVKKTDAGSSGYSGAVARHPVKAGGAPRVARPYSTGALFQIHLDPNLAMGPDTISNRSMSSLGSGDLFDPIWGSQGGRSGGGSGSGSGSTTSSANNSNPNLFAEEHGTSSLSQTTDGSSSSNGNTFGLAVEAPKSAQNQHRLSSEFSRAWHDDISKRGRAATDAGIPSFWGDGGAGGGGGGNAGEEDIHALTLSMTAMLDDDGTPGHSVI